MLERAHRACASPTGSPSPWASSSTDPRATTHLPERVPTFTLGIAERQPAGDGRGLRDLRRPVACTATRARSPRSRTRPATCSRSTPVRASRRCRRARPTRSTTSCAASRSRRLRLPARRHRPDAPVGRQDRHHPGRQGRLVRRLHPQPRDRGDDRRRQQARRPADPARTARRIAGQLHRLGVTAPAFAGPMWADAMQADPGLARPTRTSSRPTSETVNGVPVAVPSTSGHERRAPPRAPSSRPASTRSVGGPADSGSPAGTVAYTSPERRLVRPQGLVGHDLRRRTAQPAPAARRRGPRATATAVATAARGGR